MGLNCARWLIALVSTVVPNDRRDEWREEWEAELVSLDRARREGTGGLPTAVGFALGAVPHGLWMIVEGWSVDSIVQDLRFAARVLRRTPGFTLVAAGTLALGIGANASMFSLVNALVLSAPAGIEAPERMVQVARSYTDDPRWDNFSWPALQSIAATESFGGVAGFTRRSFVVGEGAETEPAVGLLVTGRYFDVLGVQPAVGRLIGPADDRRPGEHAVVVLGHGFWVRNFGADPTVVGGTLTLGARGYTIIGVAPSGFAGAESVGTPPDLFVPTMQHPGYFGELPFTQWGTSWIEVIARLGDGFTLEEARAEMDVVAARLRAADDANENILVLLSQGVGLDPEGREEAKQLTFLLLLIVGLVLLVTCTNVANLLLARAGGRRAEVGVRLALGAGRARLLRQWLTESALLAGLATALAVPLVVGAEHLVPAVVPYTLSVSVAPDERVFLFLVITGAVAAVLFGLAPAWVASRDDLVASLKSAASTHRTRTRLRDALVVSQLGLSLGLISSAALLGRSVLNASQAQPGFQAEGLTVGSVDLQSSGRYDRDQGLAFLEALHEAAVEQPGVRSATLANQLPVAGGHARASASPAGRPDVTFEAEYIIVGPDYFETLSIPILNGRALRGFGEEPERAVVVNEALARLFWPGQDAVGQEIDRGQTYRVVGVAGDVQMRSLRAAPQPAIYYPYDHAYSGRVDIQMSGIDGAAPSAEVLRSAVAAVDPGLPVGSIQTLAAALARSMSETRTIGALVSVFAGLAVVLAVIGLYGLVSYSASQRVREIGIRIALGAEPDTLVRLILARGLGIALVGAAAGVAIALALGGALRHLLYQVAHTDVLTLASATIVLLMVSGFASWLPARRASRIDAARSLRSEA